MTPSAPASGTTTCWNCGQTLPAGTQRCLYCGVPQEAQSAQLVVAPHGVVGAAPPPSMPLAPPTSAGPVAAAPTAAPAPPRPRPQAAGLGEQFAGRPAGVGARLAAFTIDVVVVAAVGVAVQLLLHSALLTALGVAEAIAVLVVLQARTGLGPGNALLRIRVARLDRPYSPGVGRSVVRGLITACGWLVAVVGAWFIEVTAAFDGTGRRRSWGDFAARTVVVAVPSRAERGIASSRPARAAAPRRATAAPVQPMPVPSAGVPGIAVPMAAVPPMPGTAAPIAPAAAAGPAPLPVASSAPPAVAPSAPPAEPPPTVVPRIMLPEPQLRSVAPPTAPADTFSRSLTRTEVAGGLAAPIARPGQEEPGGSGDALLTFDTGQREQLPVPAVANLGRNPSEIEPTDVLIVVRDPESTVSKTHVRLELTRAGTWVTDNSSTNGTDLLDESGVATRLQPGVRTQVEDGARVRLGNRVFTISTLLEGTP